LALSRGVHWFADLFRERVFVCPGGEHQLGPRMRRDLLVPLEPTAYKGLSKTLLTGQKREADKVNEETRNGSDVDKNNPVNAINTREVNTGKREQRLLQLLLTGERTVAYLSRCRRSASATYCC
jgi:hypothetical protein